MNVWNDPGYFLVHKGYQIQQNVAFYIRDYITTCSLILVKLVFQDTNDTDYIIIVK